MSTERENLLACARAELAAAEGALSVAEAKVERHHAVAGRWSESRARFVPRSVSEPPPSPAAGRDWAARLEAERVEMAAYDEAEALLVAAHGAAVERVDAARAAVRKWSSP